MKAAFHTPFDEQLAFFRQKLNLPTARWDDIMKSAHDRAFIVAGAAQADLLADLKRAVDKSLAHGFGLAEFERDFKQIVHNRGWSGWTGQGTQAGEAWRTKVIYQTNMMTSYAAGRYAQLTDPEFVKLAPYWRYVHDDSVRRPRPEHQALDGLTLPYDHPFWATHFPPNGWGCMCRITPVEAPQKGDATEPPTGWDQRDGKGNLPGVDKGFDYAPGASVADERRQIIADKRLSLPEPLGQALAEAAKKILEAPEAPVFAESKTAKAADDWAVNNNLADYADYSGVKPEVANAWNRSLFEHLQEFPELRANQKFVGTCQGQYGRLYDIQTERYIEALRRANPQLPADFDFSPHVKGKIKRLKMDDTSVWAHSWSHPDVSGIAVNKRWGSDVEAFKSSIENSAKLKWHPLGCDTLKSVADHEMGHQLDDLLSLHVDASVIAAYKEALSLEIKEEVSGYADKSIKEFIAECWAESLNTAAPRPFAQRIADIVRSRYADKFP